MSFQSCLWPDECTGNVLVNDGADHIAFCHVELIGFRYHSCSPRTSGSMRLLLFRAVVSVSLASRWRSFSSSMEKDLNSDRHLMTSTNEFSVYIYVLRIRAKSKPFEELRSYKALVENIHPIQIRETKFLISSSSNLIS